MEPNTDLGTRILLAAPKMYAVLVDIHDNNLAPQWMLDDISELLEEIER